MTTMKIVLLFLSIGATGVLLAGCGSSANQSSVTPEQRSSQTLGDKAIPAPAQGRAAQQDQLKRQMDSMRAADVNKTR